MAEGTLTLLRRYLLFVSALIFCMTASVGQQNLSAGSGGSVTLSCPVADITALEAVMWSRTDLDSDVLFARPGQEESMVQHPSYQNRARLQMKKGDASLVLVNLKTDDNGTYECQVKINKKIKLISTVSLQVFTAPPPGTQDGSRNDGGNKNRPVSSAKLLFLSLILFFALC